LYKMIRKMIGVAYDVASGRSSLNIINSMLNKPSDFYDANSYVMNPNGLFLKAVNYDQIYLEKNKIL
jgi:tRNA U38,U39,U40 pseudouridine synthase TruA